MVLGKDRLRLLVVILSVLVISPAAGQWVGAAAMPERLTVSVDHFKNGGVVPTRYAYCVPAAHGHAANGSNVSPAIAWSRGPAGTKSYAIIVFDTDVPTVFTNADKEGQTLPASMPRRDFYHWVYVDVPPAVTSLPEGADSNGVVSQGKPVGKARYGVRGANDYSDPKTQPPHGGYDGPCPPWNDTVVHHYHFRVYALDVARLPLAGAFTGPEALAAMRGHILAQGEVVGRYSTNPDIARRLGIEIK
jgi:Raf kinase inhibitor-like YbhB/YbcL family protein